MGRAGAVVDDRQPVVDHTVTERIELRNDR
jgi:hypothetical protein